MIKDEILGACITPGGFSGEPQGKETTWKSQECMGEEY